MRRTLAILTALSAVGSGSTYAQDGAPEGPGLEARVWLDRGSEPVLSRGDRVRIYYRTSGDAHVALFHINTDGALRMVSPRGPDEDHYAKGAQDYRVLFPRSPYWYVDEYEGKGYFFLIASAEPLDFRAVRWVGQEQAWDLTALGRQVYRDPYVAMDDVVATLLPDWEVVPYALDFVSYDVGAAHDYPRFLCYDCHGFRSYASWNPYSYACTDFRVVIYDDPYFAPAYRYGPTRVVYSSSFRGRARFEFKERGVGEAWSPLTRTRQPPARRPAEYLEPSAAEPNRPRLAPPRRRVVPTESLRPAEPRAATPDAAPGSAARRPASEGARVSPTGPVRPDNGRAPENPETRPRPTGAVTPPPTNRRPVLERRPSGESPAPERARPSDVRRGPVRGVTPSRPSTRPTAGSSARPAPRPPLRPTTGTPARPVVRPRPSGNAGPAARPSVRPSGGSARPTARPKPPPKKPPKRPGGGEG